MYAKKSNPINFAKVGEKVVINPDLAMTPSQMDVMRRKGLPISTNNLQDQYYDGQTPDKLSFDIPIGERRGVDISEVWSAQQTSRNKLRKMKTAAAMSAKLDNPQTSV